MTPYTITKIEALLKGKPATAERKSPFSKKTLIIAAQPATEDKIVVSYTIKFEDGDVFQSLDKLTGLNSKNEFTRSFTKYLTAESSSENFQYFYEYRDKDGRVYFELTAKGEFQELTQEEVKKELTK